MKQVLTQNEIRKNRSMRQVIMGIPTRHWDSCHDNQGHGKYAEWIDAEETTNVERGVQLQATEPEPFQRHHKDETRVNKEEEDPPMGQRPQRPEPPAMPLHPR